jgi:hypothetical protein
MRRLAVLAGSVLRVLNDERVAFTRSEFVSARTFEFSCCMLDESLTNNPQSQKGLTNVAIQERGQTRSEEASGVLIFAYYYPPVNASGSLRPGRFAKYLQRQGYRPEIVTPGVAGDQESCKGVHGTTPVGNGGRLTKTAATLVRFLERTILPYSDQLPWVPYAIATAHSVMQKRPISVVFSTSPPVGTHLAAAWIKHKFGVPWIADLRDPLLGNPCRTVRWAKAYDTLLENVIIRYADTIITNTDNCMETLRLRYPRMTEKIQLIWNGFDPEEAIQPLPIPHRDHRVLLHTGTLYGGRHPSMLLESLKRMISKGSLDTQRLHLRLIGDLENSNDPWLEKSDFANLVLAGWVECLNHAVPLEEARREMGEADYLLLLDLNQLGTGTQVPGKLFEYIRIGRPILAFTVRESSTSRILAKAGIPHVCVYQSDSCDEVDRKVSAFLLLETRPVAPSEWFQKHFNAVTQTQALADLFASLARR